MDHLVLNDVAEVTKLAGFEFTKYIKYIDDGEIIAVRALNLKNGELVLDDVKRISKAISNSLERSKLKKYDIVISYTGTIGECAQIIEDGKYHLAPNVAKITPRNNVDPNYLFQYIRSPIFKNLMKGYCHGSTQPTIPMKVIRELPITLPSLENQRKVASILQKLDSKIQYNKLINQNLEHQAQMIFNAEFLSHDEIPAEWQESNLLEIADYLNGLAMQKFRPSADDVGIPVLKIKELRQGFCDETSERCSSNIKSQYIVHDGDVVFSWSGSLLVDFWCGGTCGLNQHLFKVTSPKYDKWFYYAWTNHHLKRFASIAADMATTMGHIKREELAKSKVFIPSVEDYQRIGSLLQPIYDLVIINRIQNRELSHVRENLLPKLMSGEIDVSRVCI